MNFEALQKLWQRQAPPPAEFDPVAVLQRVRAEASAFDRKIRRRDRLEVSAALFIALVFGLVALMRGWAAWGYAVATVLVLGVAVFFVLDRRWQARRARAFDDTVLGQIDRALFLTGHQEWLLRNVAWWYLLPPGLGMFLIRLQHFLSDTAPMTWTSFALRVAGDCVLWVFVYWLNQRAVRKTLWPRLAALREVRAQFAAVVQPDEPAR